MAALIVSLKATDPLPLYEYIEGLISLPEGFFNRRFLAYRQVARRGLQWKKIDMVVRFGDIGFREQLSIVKAVLLPRIKAQKERDRFEMFLVE